MQLTDFSVEKACKTSDVIILGVPSKVSSLKNVLSHKWQEYKIDIGWVKDDAIVINVASFQNVDAEKLLHQKPGVKFIGQVGKV